MKNIEIYDPAMCCSSGVCGTDVDPTIVQFAGDLAWLKEHGIEARRFNLAQEPLAFAKNALISEALQLQGNACLPLVLVDGIIVTRSIYPTREQLAALTGLPNANCCDSSKDSEESCCGGKGRGSSCCQ